MDRYTTEGEILRLTICSKSTTPMVFNSTGVPRHSPAGRQALDGNVASLVEYTLEMCGPRQESSRARGTRCSDTSSRQLRLYSVVLIYCGTHSDRCLRMLVGCADGRIAAKDYCVSLARKERPLAVAIARGEELLMSTCAGNA